MLYTYIEIDSLMANAVNWTINKVVIHSHKEPPDIDTGNPRSYDRWGAAAAGLDGFHNSI